MWKGGDVANAIVKDCCAQQGPPLAICLQGASNRVVFGRAPVAFRRQRPQQHPQAARSPL